MQTTTSTPSNAVRKTSQDESVAQTVVFAVSEATGIDPLEMDPLYDVVDPAALEGFVHDRRNPATSDAEIRFSMAGCDVVVSPAGEVVATPAVTEETQSKTSVLAD